jgi:hypothetical protein
LTQRTKSQPKVIEQKWDLRAVSEDFGLEEISGDWRLSVGRWIGRFGRNDENAPLADKPELNRKTTSASGEMPKAAKRV